MIVSNGLKVLSAVALISIATGVFDPRGALADMNPNVACEHAH